MCVCGKGAGLGDVGCLGAPGAGVGLAGAAAGGGGAGCLGAPGAGAAGGGAPLGGACFGASFGGACFGASFGGACFGASFGGCFGLPSGPTSSAVCACAITFGAMSACDAKLANCIAVSAVVASSVRRTVVI
jgi:hypothetical protein